MPGAGSRSLYWFLFRRAVNTCSEQLYAMRQMAPGHVSPASCSISLTIYLLTTFEKFRMSRM